MTRSALRVVAVIPARYGSSRFPGKIIAPILGKPIIQWVCEGARAAQTLDEVWVATDDDRVEAACRQIEVPVFRSRKAHRSGSDRIIEALEKIQADIVVNIQGDEPLISAEMIDAAVRPMLEQTSHCPVVTLVKRIRSVVELSNHNVVKVVTDHQGQALYFSRWPIPALFENGTMYEPTQNDLMDTMYYYKHIGLYVYERDFLEKFSSLKPSELERQEQLEQLRVLENGFRIQCVETEALTVGVDKPEDIRKVEQILSKGERCEHK
ncbi:3-deoxy-manno-octulosonate cytidylyltransferase [bacterium]|nr:3-deoxy-manno-octulosonate cytidylyltransferase [bacterium]